MNYLMKSAAVFAVTSAMAFTATNAYANHDKRYPISAYLDLLSPVEAQAWNDPVSQNSIAMDVFGKLNATFFVGQPTEVRGFVMTRSNGDGTQKMSVHIRTTNALCNARSAGDLALGNTLVDVITIGATPALGTGLLGMEYTVQDGAPNLIGSFDRVTAIFTCEGELTNESGYPAGTPGIARTTQRGLLEPNSHSGECPPEQDANCFPTEIVTIRARN